jgi:uncharacterized protein (TIGR02284 family)
MKNDKTVEVLNKLLEINNDRLLGYETASKETDEQDLKTLFAQLANTSLRCKQELVDEINSLGGQPIEGTKTSGKFFRAWMDVKAALTGKNRNAIISSCEFGEDKAIETYKNVLMDDILYLSTRQLTLIRAQYALLKTDHDTVRSLRDTLKYNSESHGDRPGSRSSI